MRWAHLDRKIRVLLMLVTKTGTLRRIPLSSRALMVLDALARCLDGRVWTETGFDQPGLRTPLWDRRLLRRHHRCAAALRLVRDTTAASLRRRASRVRLAGARDGEFPPPRSAQCACACQRQSVESATQAPATRRKKLTIQERWRPITSAALLTRRGNRASWRPLIIP